MSLKISSSRAVPKKIVTPVGWKTARCSSFGQPRTVHQMVGRMPAKPVVPPTMPLSTPTPPSASRPPAVTLANCGRTRL